ncbi:metal ABC transporter substrate-binding protein [Nocardioides baekrokdamisoli]|uniref:Metal ABC transporter substrate-binding protein n=1 Tax=Nocardioides baekrokdamisoli TaxID=1804624 RepID=A0A3G9IB96_9ACTN|nr:zinc ABC transporter substrate-binding protein [Nocardioides baekrokdamisoli]BBH16070.1 metal ABC transporter substrate-binding protein [Nocardioides baekrokdamisoli]
MIRRLSLALILVAGLCLTACGTSPASDGRIRLVASTNVWGEIAQEIGGDHVDVTSFISNPSTDPHSYEADAQNQLAIANAKVVIENGGGYDDFMDTMLKASGSKATVINAVKVASVAQERPCLSCGSILNPRPVAVTNEHVWYDLRTVTLMSSKIEAALAAADPTHATTYKANQQAFAAKIDALDATIGAFFSTHLLHLRSVGITEPVPVYLLNAMGIRVITPTAFSKAIEEGSGVPVLVMQQVKQQISGHQIRALVYNAQTSGPETSQVLATAGSSNVPTVPVTETIPSGMTYVSWMTLQVDAIIKAVG